MLRQRPEKLVRGLRGVVAGPQLGAERLEEAASQL
jgi:hypothetical protein